MAAKSKFRPYWIRLWVVLAVSLVFAAAFNEFAYLLQKDRNDRAPMTITLVIPVGTAERVAAGEAVPEIPPEMVFVLGDTLEVKNEDTVSHQLGPVWVPAGATGSLVMKEATSATYQCSFQTSRYLGVDVRQPTTWGTRLTGLMLATPTVAVLLYLYSLLVFPVQSKAVKQTPSNGVHKTAGG
jgi:hypothetical protein